MSKKSRLSRAVACDQIRAQRAKMEMSKVNHLGVMNSKRFHLI